MEKKRTFAEIAREIKNVWASRTSELFLISML